LKIKSVDENKIDQEFAKGEEVEVYEEIQGYEGWAPARVKEIKGEFFLVEFKNTGKTQTKIMTRNNIRQRKEGNVIDLNAEDKVVKYSLGYLQNHVNKQKKIQNLSKQIESLVKPYFIYSLINEIQINELFVFFDDEFDEEKIQLLEAIMSTVQEHYVKFT
jgi:hypothetical protein